MAALAATFALVGAAECRADHSLDEFPRLAGETGYEIDAKYTRLLGCTYFNNEDFGLDDITVIRHISGKLLVADGAIVKTARNFKVYEGCGTVKWRDMMYSGFSSGDSTPGAAAFGE